MVPANCTDQLQPLPAKEQMRQYFQEWYGQMILQQLEDEVEEVVDMRLSVMKPLASQWIINTFKYLESNPNIIINGFRAAGSSSILKD